MNQERYNTIKKIMESISSTTCLKPTNKCKMQNILQFIRLQKLNITLEDVIGYYDYSLFGGGKKALLLTSDFIYSSSDGKITKPLVFSEILSTRYHEHNLIVTKKDSEETIFLPVYNQYVSELINAILKQYPTKTIEQEAEEVSQQVQKALAEKLAELERIEKEAEEKKREEERIAKEKAERYAKLSDEEKELVKKAEVRKQRIEKELASTSKENNKGVDGVEIAKQFKANPKASAYFSNALEVAIYNINKAVALIDKEHFTAKNKIDIQRHFKDVNLNDVVYFYDGYTVHKEKQWAVVTPKELIVTNGFRLSLTGILSCRMSSDQSYLYIKYFDREETVHYKKFSTYVVQIIVQGTIKAYNNLWNHAWDLEQQKKYQEAFHYHLEAAINGCNSAAFNSVGIYFNNGWYVKQDKEHSYEWYEKGSEVGNTYAMSNLTIAYKNIKEYDKTWKHLKKALEITEAQNYSTILNTAGLMYKDGLGVQKDLYKALDYFKKSSDKGNMYGTYNLADHALFYDFDYKKGLEYTLKAINQNHKAGYKLLADCYQYGRYLPKNEENALYWYMEAKNKNNSAANFGIAQQYLNNHKYDDAIIEYEDAIEKGNTYGYYTIAKVYLNPDYKGYNVDEALYNLEKGVHKGSSAAMLQLAKMYIEGNGVVQDYQKALELIEQAMEKNDTNAYGHLALMYLNGWGVNKNKQKAMEIFKKGLDTHSSASTYEYAKVCLTHKDFNVHDGIEHLFELTKRKGNPVYLDVLKTLIDYLSKNKYNLTPEQKVCVFDIFNELIEKEPSYLDKKANLERYMKTTVPVYANKVEIDWKTLETKTKQEQLVTLLDIVANNPKHYEACNALGKLYFSILSYKEAWYYHKIAFSVDGYKNDPESMFQYYYLCVEVKHEYDKGKQLYQLLNTSYQEGRSLFIKLIHKYREEVKKYEYSYTMAQMVSLQPQVYGDMVDDFRNTILNYHDDLRAHYSKADPTFITSLYQKAKNITNSYDKKLQEMEKMYRDDYEKVYDLAKKGCVAAIQQYLKYGNHVYLSYEDYAHLANVYSLLNESITKDGIVKLINYHKSSYKNNEKMNVVRDAILFYDDVDSFTQHFDSSTEVDEAFYNAVVNTFANSKDIDTIGIVTKLNKNETISPLNVMVDTSKALASALEHKVVISDMDKLQDLYENKQFKIVYENVSELAKQNNPKAQVLLGKLYHYGYAVNKDIELAKQWYTKASNAEARLYLVHLAYDRANSPSEFEKIFTLYEELQNHIDEIACNNVLQMLPFISVDYNRVAFWKLGAYVFGNQKAGKEVATLFFTGMIDTDFYLSIFEDMAFHKDPLALRILATAHRMPSLGIVDEKRANLCERQLMEVLTGQNNIDPTAYTHILNSIKKKEVQRNIFFDYLFSIDKCDSKTLYVEINGDKNFIFTCSKLINTFKVDCFIAVNNEYYNIEYFASKTLPRSFSLFKENTEVTFIAFGNNRKDFLHDIQRYIFHTFLEEKPALEVESKLVDECWALHDNGEYEKAYEKVLPLAKQGIPKAINMLGLLFYHGKGIEQDIHKAHEWFEMGIKKKYSPCYLNMGNLYYNYASDETLGKKYAYQYYLMIINTASANICKRALEILLSGIVPRDPKEAERWSKRLIELGETDYLKSLNKES